MVTEETLADEAAEWHLRLFRKSLLKQDKLRSIENLLGNTDGESCLDIGGDNGVISYFLRKNGGDWSSADMTSKAVLSTGKLVGEDQAFLIEDYDLPFPDNSMDIVVIIDYLEHVEQDDLFVQEIHRVLKQSGTLIANVPHHKPLGWIRLLRKLLGLTDEMHGHVRPGYTNRQMYDLLKDGFDIVESRTYSRFFVQFVDTGIQFIGSFMGGGHAPADEPSKGVLIDEEDFYKYQKAFRLYSLIYPFIWLAAKLDFLIFWTKGYALIVKARSRPWRPRREVKLVDQRSIADATLNTKIGTAAPF